MKIVTYVVIALLIAALGAAAVFYFYMYQPMATDYARMKAGMPELDKAKAELKKFKEREVRESAWINPAIDILSAGLSDEIKSGKAEVLSAGNRVIVNISESALYLPGSYTFLKEKESQPLLRKLDSLLRDEKLKGKTIIVGNTTEAAPAQGKGRKKIPSKDARTLAADRSAVLIKYLEKSGVNQDALVAAAYSSKQPEIGFNLKSHKTVLIIENPLAAPPVASKQETGQQPQSKSTPTVKAPAGAGQPAVIPIKPAQPKAK